MRARLVRLRRRMWPMPMSAVLAGTFGVLIGLSVAIVLYLSVKANYQNTFSLLNEKSVLLVRALEDGMKARLDPARRALAAVKAHYDSGGIDLADAAQLREVLTGALAANDAIEAWVVYDRDFAEKGMARTKDGTLEWFDEEGKAEPQVVELLSSIAPGAGVTWAPLVYTQYGVFTSAAVPLVRDGRIERYLVAAINTDFLSRLVGEIGSEYGATAFVLEAPYKLVAHSRGEALGLAERRSLEHPSVPLPLAGDEVLARLPFARVGDSFAEADRKGVEVRAVEVGGQPYVVMTGTFEGFGPNPWTLGVYFRRADVGSEVERIMLSACAGLVALVVAVVLAVLLGRRIARPIERTAQRFRRIADLDLDSVSELPPSRIRELDDEARSFNAMLNGLRAFTAYVPRSLARKLLRRGLEEAGRSRQAELTVLFTDIDGFTRLSETLPAAETVAILNRHFAILVSCIEAEDGTIDKYLGDGLLAFWNAPDEKPDHADAAVRAALAIRSGLAADNRRAAAEGRPQIRIRIGIHTGPVIVGNIGALDRVNYTIVGDTVNLCQRLQGLGKDVAGTAEAAILISDETRLRLSADHRMDALGEHFVKGREAAVRVWSLAEVASADDRSQAQAPSLAAE